MTFDEPHLAEPPPAETPAHRVQRLAAHLASIRDPQSRFAWLVELARKRRPLETNLRLDAHRISGCMVRSWWIAEFANGRCRFSTDSDAVTLKAVLGAVADICTGGTPAEIVALDFDFLNSLGVLRQLAENRQATILRVIASMKEFAASCR
jgi:cysteine desulfuration protein SufE